MRQFDLDEYLKNPNRKVVTRDGRSVRIVCTDMRSGWINIYSRTGDANASRRIYDTEEEALKCASVERVDTIKIEWEE